MENRGSQILVSFSISGRDFDTEQCSARVGRRPSETWQQERPHLKERRDLANTAWMVSSGWEEGDSLDEAVAKLLDEVWPYAERIRQYSLEQGLSLTLNCSVRVWSDAPQYTLSVDVMRKLVHLGAEFGLDIYDYREDSKQE